MPAAPQKIYPPVKIKTPMPAFAPTELEYQGRRVSLPGRFDHGSATYLFSLMDPMAALQQCEGENFEPILMHHPDGAPMAIGCMAALDYHQTDVGPYREWFFGIWVTSRGKKKPTLIWKNATSLIFYGILPMNIAMYSPKMILTEDLPIDAGVDLYGIPKEKGEVFYERQLRQTRFEVHDSTGQWWLKAHVPNTRGMAHKGKIFVSLVQAFGLQAIIKMAFKKELALTLAGSAKLLAKNAWMVAKADPHTELFLWQDEDCCLEINENTRWGKILLELKFRPLLVSHIPHIAFVLSGPFDPKHSF